MTRIACVVLLTFVVFSMSAPVVWAAAGPQDPHQEKKYTEPFDQEEASSNQYLAIAIGWGLGLAVLGGALGQGRAISASVEAIARQPEAGGRIFGAMIIGLALIETLVIYIWVTTFVMMGNFAPPPAIGPGM